LPSGPVIEYLQPGGQGGGQGQGKGPATQGSAPASGSASVTGTGQATTLADRALIGYQRGSAFPQSPGTSPTGGFENGEGPLTDDGIFAPAPPKNQILGQVLPPKQQRLPRRPTPEWTEQGTRALRSALDSKLQRNGQTLGEALEDFVPLVGTMALSELAWIAAAKYVGMISDILNAGRVSKAAIEAASVAAAEGRIAAGEVRATGPEPPAYPKSPKGKGSVPPSQRDPKRVWPKSEKVTQLEKQDGLCAKCGKDVDIGDARGHHRTRHADGGMTNDANHDILCEGCHKEVHQ
jgi:hypothetical protein